MAGAVSLVCGHQAPRSSFTLTPTAQSSSVDLRNCSDTTINAQIVHPKDADDKLSANIWPQTNQLPTSSSSRKTSTTTSPSSSSSSVDSKRAVARTLSTTSTDNQSSSKSLIYKQDKTNQSAAAAAAAVGFHQSSSISGERGDLLTRANTQQRLKLPSRAIGRVQVRQSVVSARGSKLSSLHHHHHHHLHFTTQPKASAATTNSRVRQGDLYARRHQYHVTSASREQQQQQQKTTRSIGLVVQNSSLKGLQNSNASSTTTQTTTTTSPISTLAGSARVEPANKHQQASSSSPSTLLRGSRSRSTTITTKTTPTASQIIQQRRKQQQQKQLNIGSTTSSIGRGSSRFSLTSSSSSLSLATNTTTSTVKRAKPSASANSGSESRGASNVLVSIDSDSASRKQQQLKAIDSTSSFNVKSSIGNRCTKSSTSSTSSASTYTASQHRRSGSKSSSSSICRGAASATQLNLNKSTAAAAAAAPATRANKLNVRSPHANSSQQQQLNGNMNDTSDNLTPASAATLLALVQYQHNQGADINIIQPVNNNNIRTPVNNINADSTTTSQHLPLVVCSNGNNRQLEHNNNNNNTQKESILNIRRLSSAPSASAGSPFNINMAEANENLANGNQYKPINSKPNNTEDKENLSNSSGNKLVGLPLAKPNTNANQQQQQHHSSPALQAIKLDLCFNNITRNPPPTPPPPIQKTPSSISMERSNSLGSSLESADEQMVLGSPLVTPPPSESDVDVDDDDDDDDDLSETNNNILVEKFNEQDNNSKLPVVLEIPIKLEPICDYYDLELRPFARGKFAQVKHCINKLSKQCFAAKCIKKRRRLVDIRHEILLEIDALKLSYYTNRIVKLYEVFETPSEMILVLELAKGGELQRVLDDEECIDEIIAKRMVDQILEGLVHLHDNNIAHLDIKPQNLLLTDLYPNGDVKLCDFGISRRITKECEIREICGTPDYVAPEILRYDPIGLATDMWSLGVLTYVILSGYSPFGSDNKQQTFCNITQANLDFPNEIFGKISKEAIDFMQKLIIREPSERLTSRQARKHPWFTSLYLKGQRYATVKYSESCDNLE